MTAFYKMHGLGNDFVVFDARARGLALDEAAARAVADRRLGVGCDQVIVIERPRSASDALMRIFNADGDEVEACGNAARCVARLLMEEKDATDVRIETLGGKLSCSDAGEGAVTVDMGAPKFAWQDIPLAKALDTGSFSIGVDGREFTAAAVSIGNPHCVILVEDAEQAPVAEVGSRIERHPLFPSRTNVEFVTVVAPGRLRMRVWERGAGVTLACGTGACAAAVTVHRRGLGPRVSDVLLDGGTLHVEWRLRDDHILMTGPTSHAFTGNIDLTTLDARQ